MSNRHDYLRREDLVLRHTFRDRAHDPFNCEFCDLLDTADFYERKWLEARLQVDELKGRLSTMTAKRDRLKSRCACTPTSTCGEGDR